VCSGQYWHCCTAPVFCAVDAQHQQQTTINDEGSETDDDCEYHDNAAATPPRSRDPAMHRPRVRPSSYMDYVDNDGDDEVDMTSESEEDVMLGRPGSRVGRYGDRPVTQPTQVTYLNHSQFRRRRGSVMVNECKLIWFWTSK